MAMAKMVKMAMACKMAKIMLSAFGGSKNQQAAASNQAIESGSVAAA
jgi:hypothetical protein